MRTEFVYSISALAAFPIAVNAQVDASTIGKITAAKDGTAWTKDISLVKGKYTFKSALATGTAGKKATVSILDQSTGSPIVPDFDVVVGNAIQKDFVLTADATVTIKVVSETAEADFVADESVVQLNFNFSKVAELLQIEYNKVTQVLNLANYDGKEDDAQKYSALYDRIVAIANADYAFYEADTEGLLAIYDDQTDVTGLTLYTEIQNALKDVKTNQVANLDGADGLAGLNTRYDNLKASGSVISYITDDLTNAKDAAKTARDAFDSNPTAANLNDAYAKIAAYKKAIEDIEAVKDANEKANSDLLAELAKVYGNTDSYYQNSLTQINNQYTAPRYSDLKAEVKAALAAIVSGDDYKNVKKAIEDQYKAKKSAAEKNNLINTIAEFKEKLTRVVSDYSTVRGQLAEVYDIYDAQDAAAKALVDGDATLKTYKDDVVAKVGDLLSFIEANDQFATVANLTETAIQPYLDAIVTATNTYNDQSGIYGDYQALKDAVAAQTTSLNDAKTAVDADAKDAKKLDETVFKPTTIWATTISAIENLITTLDGNVDTNRATANTYKNTDEYKKALKKIKDQIAAFKTNALAATAKYAEINTLVTETEALRAGLLDTSVEPLKDIDLTALNVWSNQVTIDDAVKARTPYKNFIADGTGSITTAIATLATQLADAPNKKAVLNNKKDNKTNILPYLNSLDLSEVTSGNTTMNDIKDNYSNDEQKFQDQIDQQECEGIITLINDKAVVFEAAIKTLQDNINAKKYGNANAAKLQEEIDAITAKIDAAKAVAAKEGATKAELTAAYNSIKDLETTDIATAQTNAAAYEASFVTSTGFYNTLKGATTDASTVKTLGGLTNKVTEQKAAIDGMTALTDAQKTALKDKVDAVEVVKQEGDPAVDVTYNLTNIITFIETAWQDETLNTAEVSRYQGIIGELQAATDVVVNHAGNLDYLEGQLAAIDFNKAKNDILAKDPNENGFFVNKLLGNAAAGECTFDFNTLKGKIEADEDITDAEKTAYNNEIDGIKTTIAGLPDAAKNNLKAWEDAQKAYSADRDPENTDIWGNGGAVQQYEAAIAKLEAEYATSKLDAQKTELATLKDALDQLKAKAEENYNAGTATAADATAINNKLAEIKNKWEEFTNPVNYNGQIAADNKAIYEGINAAHAAADAQYAISSSIINTYKNFKSTELQAAAEQAQTELQALLTYLEGYDALVAEIQGRADAAYGKIVSPEKFDTEESYKAEFEAVEAELQELTQALADKIKEFGGANVAASVEAYTDAIAASKAKVAKFSSDDKDLPEATVDGLFSTIDGMLEAITSVQDDDTKIKDLDKALHAAAASGTGIKGQITTVEQAQAATALNGIIATIDETYMSDWTPNDQDRYADIKYYANSTYAYYKAYCVTNFANWKAELNEIKAMADQLAADKAAIAAATTAINVANNALKALIADYPKFAAGYQVKADVEAIAATLQNYPIDGLNATNAADWEAAAKAIYTPAAGTTLESGTIIDVYNKLFDAEVETINGLIATAKEENLTYSGGTPGLSDKATISARISAQETALAAAQEAVAKNPDETGYKTKKDALLNDLSGIELILNADIETMTTGNETNINDVIKANLEQLVNNQQDRLDVVLDDLQYGGYCNVYGYWKPYLVPSALNTDKVNIQKAIDALNQYIFDHASEIDAYQANAREMLQDITADITALANKVSDEKARQDKANENNGFSVLRNLWNTIQGSIDSAQDQIEWMNGQLERYGSASNYTNKVNKLNAQITTAQSILDEAQDKAEGKDAMQDKYTVAKGAETDVNTALTNVEQNCDDIVDLAKGAYIDAFIDKLNAQIIADTWTASSNYTATDKNTLTTMLSDLKASVNNLKTSAYGFAQAEVIYNYWGDIISNGVIATLDEGEAQFNTDLAALKQAVKDMSLVEDKKGHVSGNDDISTDDLMDLADIILNGEEDTADLEACDMNGDGEIDVTDLVWLRYFLVHEDWPTAGAAARSLTNNRNSDVIEMQTAFTENGITRLAINLSNGESYKAFQISMQLPAGAKMVGKSLGERVDGTNLMSKENNGVVTFIALSTANNVIAGNDGAVLYVDIEGLNGEVVLGKAIFTTVDFNSVSMNGNGTTGIRETIANAVENAGKTIYNLGGKVMNGLKKGLNIIRNADGTTKKVINK